MKYEFIYKYIIMNLMIDNLVNYSYTHTRIITNHKIYV